MVEEYNTKKKIELGLTIRDKLFNGNPYSQLGYLMEGIRALKIINNESSTEEELNWANNKLDELDNLYNEIQSLINNN